MRPVTLMPVWSESYGRQVVAVPRRHVVAEIATYNDELFAYLMFTYLRGAPALRDTEPLLTYSKSHGRLAYTIQAHLNSNLLGSLPHLAAARIPGVRPQYEWRQFPDRELARMRYQTSVMITAYNLPRHRALESLTPMELATYVRRFVRFKSITDPRIRARLQPAARVLDDTEARLLAEDIVTVSNFYAIPVDSFLGIGAIENNFMNIPGDLEHAVWKRRPARDDIVLKRRKGRVLVLNQSSGIWQITRETLRYAHELYLADTRDYSRLPERLRPPQDLNLNDVAPEVLTTYAGLLFRDLLTVSTETLLSPWALTMAAPAAPTSNTVKA